MKTNALIASPEDSVVTLTAEAVRGGKVCFSFDGKFAEVTAEEDVPIYHKLAVKSVKKGQPVIKYGEVIGIARADIQPGEWVHTHNLSSDGR